MVTTSKRLVSALIAGLALAAASAASAAEAELRFDHDIIKLELGAQQRASWGLRGWSRMTLSPTRPLFANRSRITETPPIAIEIAASPAEAAPARAKARAGFRSIALTAPMDELRGVAAWAGANLDGRLTTSGERYDIFRLTAASADLPLNSFVAVTNPETGQSVVVRINDRKPADGRMLTLSMAAAKRIGLDQTPEAQVTARFLGDKAAAARLASETRVSWPRVRS